MQAIHRFADESTSVLVHVFRANVRLLASSLRMDHLETGATACNGSCGLAEELEACANCSRVVRDDIDAIGGKSHALSYLHEVDPSYADSHEEDAMFFHGQHVLHNSSYIASRRFTFVVGAISHEESY